MSKKYLVLLILMFHISITNAEISSKFIIDSKIKGNEFISIAITPLTKKKQIEDLKVNVESNRDYLNFMRPAMSLSKRINSATGNTWQRNRSGKSLKLWL